MKRWSFITTIQRRSSETYHRLSYALAHMSLVQKIILGILALGMTVGAIGSFVYLITTHTQRVPESGGSFTEGIVGTPRFINPVLATSPVDKDVTALVYASLIDESPDGYTHELATGYTISDDGRTYTFTLDPSARFHDGEPVDADDIAFTISLLQNNTVKSPLRPEWLGVETNVIDEHTIEFNLERPYAGFLHNATVGILPQHVWGAIPTDQIAFSELNIRPIGAGPYEIAKVRKNNLGITSRLTLSRFSHYIQSESLIRRIHLRFYANIDEVHTAYRKGSVDAFTSTDPLRSRELTELKKTDIHTAPLPRVFALFFNQNQNDTFLDDAVINAIETAIPREALLTNVLAGYGTPVCGPLPPSAVGYQACPEDIRLQEERITDARDVLTEAGWDFDETQEIFMRDNEKLSFTMSTVDNDELKKTATFVQDVLNDVGIDVVLQIFEPGNFDQEVLRPRSYEALLFGHIIEHDTDMAALWHSDGRNDPGLNIGVYTNAIVDERVSEAVRTTNRDERAALYADVYDAFTESQPAVFLYTPDMLYIHARRLHIGHISIVDDHADRYNTITDWYRYTDRTWKQ